MPSLPAPQTSTAAGVVGEALVGDVIILDDMSSGLFPAAYQTKPGGLNDGTHVSEKGYLLLATCLLRREARVYNAGTAW